MRAESRLEAHDEVREDRVTVAGTLHDELGAPLGRRFVIVRLVADGDGAREHRKEVRTDARGSFRATFPRPPGAHRAVVRFDGDATHDGSRVERPVDGPRDAVRLRIHAGDGGRLTLSRPEHEIIVWATSRAGADALPVALFDERDRVLGRATTDRSGRAVFRVASDTFQGPGPGRLRVRSEGDERRQEAQVEVPILRERRPRLALDAPRSDPSGEVLVGGSLTDAEAPLAGRAVGLFAEGGRHLSTTLTGADGRFLHRLAREDMEGGSPMVRARFDGDGSGTTATQSSPVALPTADPPATPWPWLLAPMLATAVLLTWLRLARHRANLREPIVAGGASPEGMSPGAASTRSRERRDLAGRVIDKSRGSPLASATATAVPSDGSPRTLAVDAQGCFRVTELPEGDVHLRVEAPGYAPVEASIRLPHRGEWSRAVVRMESLRARALAVFRRVATRLLPGLQWPTWTNREVQARAQTQGAGPHFDRLAERVERLYYGRAHPTGEDVDEVEATADAAIAEVDGPATPTQANVDGRGGGSL